jgi:hypothetical protein
MNEQKVILTIIMADTNVYYQDAYMLTSKKQAVETLDVMSEELAN